MKKGIINIGVQLAVIGLLLVIGLFFNGKRLNDYPIYTHAWAQSDRYALAEGFQNNHLNFFKPEALVYNHQYPDDWQTEQETTRTAVDFPVHDYAVACCMKLLGTDSPWVFRSYIFLYGLLGLFFLFRLSYLLTGNLWRSVFVTLFGASSPVFFFYQVGFLPTIPSLANAIIGIYLYVKFLKNGKTKTWNWMVFFFILAALSRTTFIIPFCAVLGVELIRVIKRQTKFWNKLPAALLGFVAVIGYMMYNGYLRNNYGSLFLFHLLPAKDFAQLVEIFNQIWNNLVLTYFSIYHYFILLLAIMAVVWTKLRLKSKFGTEYQYLTLFLSFYFVGTFLFVFFMFGQMNVHDYYFLDTLFLPILVGLILMFAFLPNITKRLRKGVSLVLATGVLFLCFLNAQTVVHDRTEKYVLAEFKAGVEDFKGSELWLDKQGVKRTDKILVIASPTPNTPFILMKRKGFTTHRLSEQILQNSRTWGWDYVVFQNQYFYSKGLQILPELLDNWEYISSNGKLTLCRKRKTPKVQSIIQFMGLKNRKPILYEKFSTNKKENPNWSKLTVGMDSLDEEYLFLDEKEEYAASYVKTNWSKLTEGPTILSASMQVKMIGKKETFVVLVVSDKNENALYYSYPIHENVEDEKDWQIIEFYSTLPQVKNAENGFSFFFYNKGSKMVKVKDLEFRITDFN